MAVSVGTLDSWTASINTPHTLDAEKTVNGIYQFFLDAKNLANGDTLIVTVSAKVDSGEAAQVMWSGSWSHALAEPLIFSPQLTCVGSSLTVSVNQTAGTGRAFKGRIVSWT
jgi:hypothetical protein